MLGTNRLVDNSTLNRMEPALGMNCYRDEFLVKMCFA
jgi:hypothetical protein